jgi:hypothetical protein
MHNGMEKKFRYILITISFLLGMPIMAQDTLILKEVRETTCLEMDVKGNIFVADQSLTLYKYSLEGTLITNVSIKSYGELTSIDCSNPFEIYTFHKDQNIIVFYDNMLNVRGELRLNEHFFTNVSCIARSFDNQIWILDLSVFKLLKLNKSGEVLAESPYLNNVLGGDLNTFKIWEYNNMVYVADSVVGIYEFDMYATYSTTYYIAHVTAAESYPGGFYLSCQNQLWAYQMLAREPRNLKVALPQVTYFTTANRKMYYLYQNKIISYLNE